MSVRVNATKNLLYGDYFVRIVVAIKGVDLYENSITLGPLSHSLKKLYRACYSFT